MNENNLEGFVKTEAGKFESAAGDMLGDRSMQARGGARQVEGKAQDVIGSAQDALGQVAELARSAVSKANDQAKNAYGRVSEAAQGVADKVNPFVKDKPSLALGIAAAAGLLAGLLFAGSRPVVVHFKPKV